MAALTEPKNRLPVANSAHSWQYPPILGFAGDIIVYRGAAVCVNSSGYLVNAAANDTYKTMGVFIGPDDKVDTTDLDDGDIETNLNNINVVRGAFRFTNDEDDPVLAHHSGQWCYWVDNDTVSISSDGGDRPKAGIVRFIDSDSNEVSVDLAHTNPM